MLKSFIYVDSCVRISFEEIFTTKICFNQIMWDVKIKKEKVSQCQGEQI